jgi:hypothetical protein
MRDYLHLHSENAEKFFAFKNVAISLLAGNGVLYAGNPEQWILDTELLTQLLNTEAERFAQGDKDATKQEGNKDTTSNGEVLRKEEG